VGSWFDELTTSEKYFESEVDMTAPTYDTIRADLLQLMRQLRDDWNWSGEIGDSTGIFRELGFESIDLVALGSMLEEHFNRTLPFAEFLTKAREDRVEDITIGAMVAFLVANLTQPDVQPV
jgi:acyl carrier protein